MVCLVFRRAAILRFVGVVILESDGDIFGVLGAFAELLYLASIIFIYRRHLYMIF